MEERKNSKGFPLVEQQLVAKVFSVEETVKTQFHSRKIVRAIELRSVYFRTVFISYLAKDNGL